MITCPNPQLWNLYAYCRNNPITYLDPDGKIAETNFQMSLTTVQRSGMLSVELPVAGFISAGIAGYVAPRIVSSLYAKFGDKIAQIGHLKRLINATKSGTEGSKSRIRVIKGTLEDAKSLYNKLSRGGKIIKNSTYNGRMAEFKSGARVGLRNVSKTGPPTIDINLPNIEGIFKIKIK